MRKYRLTALMAVLTVTVPAFAIENAAPQDTSAPLAARAQSNLSKSGLLRSYFESDQYGSVQYRMGQQRLTVGAAASSTGSERNYHDATSDTVLPINFMFALPDGKSLIRLGGKWTFANGANYPIEQNGGIGRVDLHYLRFPTTGTMWGIGGFYDHTDLDIEGSGKIKRIAKGIRMDLLKQLSPHWGISMRSEYSWGDSNLNNRIAPAVILRHKQGDDHLYTQAEMIGQFRNQDLGLIPHGWVAHPVLGIQFRRSFIDATADNFGVVSSGVLGSTENYGTVWAHWMLEKEVAPGNWSPHALIGIEREYENDLDVVAENPDYAVMGAGASILLDRNNRFEISYMRHQGLQGRRWNQVLICTLSLNY